MNDVDTSKKVVMVIEEGLPLGLAANTAAVLALTLGRQIETIIGPDLHDASGERHTGITTMPLPILRCSGARLRELRSKANEAGLFVVDVSDAAQTTTNYDAYRAKLSDAPETTLCYLGLALYGDRKAVSRLTGNLPLLK